MSSHLLCDSLDSVDSWLQRFVVFPNDHGSVAVSLWIAATHIADRLDTAPYLLVTAPEIESGKTRLMEVAAPLCHKPIFSSSMTPAVLFRTIDATHPTLFLDEADNIWTGRGDDKSAELVALLNAGHRRGMKAQRMGGPGKTTLQEFDVFGPKCIAGAFPDLGRLPEALRSRAIHLRMKRKLPGEQVARWTRQTRESTADEIAALVEQLRLTLEGAAPADLHIDPLEDLSDRDFDVWEPLLQIAGRAGGRWPSAAREAAVALCAADPSQGTPSRLQLLRDVEEIWDGSEPFMLTSDILDRLHSMPERQWGDLYGSPLTAHRLGKFLSSYSVTSRAEPRRDGEGSKRRNGYYLQDLEDTWARYGAGTSPSPPSPPSGAKTVISGPSGDDGEDGELPPDRDSDAKEEREYAEDDPERPFASVRTDHTINDYRTSAGGYDGGRPSSRAVEYALDYDR